MSSTAVAAAEPAPAVEAMQVDGAAAAAEPAAAAQQPVTDDSAAAAAVGAADGPAAPAAPAAAPAAAAAGDGSSSKPKKQTKRKVAMHVAYLGAGYHGMQRNPGCVTIESELEGALTKAGAISAENAGSFQKIHWNRAARTDKGVSALCQVVSAKLMIEPKDSFAERVNAHLPQQVRVFGVQRATEGFDARKFCDKRKYEYVLPAWAFDPQAAAAGRGEQQQQQQQQQQKTSTAKREARKGSSSARLADQAAAMQAIAAAVLAAEVPEQQQQQQEAAAVEGQPSGSAGADGTAAAAAGGGGGESESAGNGQPSSSKGGGSRQESAQDELASTSKVGTDVLHRLRQDIASSRQRYVFGDSQLARLNGLLSQYEGTHNYHNYTIRVSSSDAAASRYIISFSASAITIQGQPWVRLVVVGQSFMLHQIRKMVGMVLAIMRGVAPEECLALALDPDRDIYTPMAPELGLFLDETYYDAYNARFGELHGPVTFEPYRQDATDFKHNVLYNHIAALDDRELVNALWLRGCTDAHYRFSKWASQPKARDSSNITQQQRERQQQQQQQKANGQQDNKRKQGDGSAAAAGAEQQQQQPPQGQPLKQQRLERPGKLDGASAAMVVGMQETYGMRPHSDTPQAAEQRRELKEMREDYDRSQAQHQQQHQHQQHQHQHQQQQQQQQTTQQQQQQQAQQQPAEVAALPEVAPEELDSLYD